MGCIEEWTSDIKLQKIFTPHIPYPLLVQCQIADPPSPTHPKKKKMILQKIKNKNKKLNMKDWGTNKWMATQKNEKKKETKVWKTREKKLFLGSQ
jgi:hypothetical protein